MAMPEATQSYPTRRTLIASAAALPVTTVPAFARAAPPDDDRLPDLIRHATETGLSIDLLEAATRGLDRASQDTVLRHLSAFAGRFVVTVQLRNAHDTPILRLFRQYETIEAAANAHIDATPGVDEEELARRYYQHSDRIEAEMMALPCTCAADFAAKMLVDTSRGTLTPDWEVGAIWQEARILTDPVCDIECETARRARLAVAREANVWDDRSWQENLDVFDSLMAGVARLEG